MRSTARFRRAGAVLILSLCAAAAGVPGGGLRALVGDRSLLGDPSAASAYPFNPWAEPVHPPVPTPLPLPPVPPTTVPSPGATPGVPAGPGYPPYFGGYQYGIPANVYAAYYRAAAAMRVQDAGCHLSWAMLAGVGKIESGHARGGDLYADGTTRTRIIGIALDGSRSGTATVPDSDSGAWDGDARWDHAVGPMQFLPGTWRHFGQDGNIDGRRDPHNMHDSALAASTYLCAGGRDLATSSGLQAAIFAYNPSDAYVAAVIAWINVYRQSGVPVPTPQGPSTPPPTHTAPPTATHTPTHPPSRPPSTAKPKPSPSPTPRTPKPTASPTGAPPDTSTPTPTVSPTPAPGESTPTGTGCPTATPTDTTSPSGTPTECPTPADCPTGTSTPSTAPSEVQPPDPSAAPSCPMPSPATSEAPTAAPSDGSAGTPTGEPPGGAGDPTGSPEPSAPPAKDEKPLAREEEPASTPAVASSSESSGTHAPTPTAPLNPADATARVTVGAISAGATRVADPDLVGTITITPIRDGWQVSVEHLRGMGGTVRHLDQLDARIRESIAAQYGSAAGRSVLLVAVLDEDVVSALRAVRRTADQPNSAAATEARIAFGRAAAAAGLPARDVHYLIAAAR